MNAFWHFLILHGIKLAFISLAIGSRFYRWRVKQATKNSPKMPPQSSSSPAPMKPQNMSLPDVKKTQPKIEGSPWSSNDPFK